MTRTNPNSAGQPADFVDAHRRHWEDGNLLYDHDRWANAAYLLGFSAECGLKAAMHVLKWMPLDPMGTPRKPRHRQHIQAIWPLYAGLALNRLGARYGLAPGNHSTIGRIMIATPTAAMSAEKQYTGTGRRPEKSPASCVSRKWTAFYETRFRQV